MACHITFPYSPKINGSQSWPLCVRAVTEISSSINGRSLIVHVSWDVITISGRSSDRSRCWWTATSSVCHVQTWSDAVDRVLLVRHVGMHDRWATTIDYWILLGPRSCVQPPAVGLTWHGVRRRCCCCSRRGENSRHRPCSGCHGSRRTGFS